MKKTIWILVLALLISSCDKVGSSSKHLVKCTYKSDNWTDYESYEWSGNKLTKRTVVEDGHVYVSFYYKYNGDNLVEITRDEQGGGLSYEYLSYNGNQLKEIYSMYDGKRTTSANEFCYNDKGNITSYTVHNLSNGDTYRFAYEWENGNFIKATMKYEWADKGSHSCITKSSISYTYDDKPSAYTGFPIDYAGIDGITMLYLTKNNRIDSDYEYVYEGDYLVAKKSKTGSGGWYYLYSDGTGLE